MPTKFIIWEGRPKRRPLPRDTIMLRLMPSLVADDGRVMMHAVNYLGKPIVGGKLMSFRNGGAFVITGVNPDIPIVRDDEGENSMVVEIP